MATCGRRPPSQTWRTFLDNHINTTAACDCFVVPTATTRLLWCFLILSHDRRRIVHFNVTDGPSQEVITAYRSPWQNPYAERVIGTIRRECTDHLIVLGENHLRRLLKEYVRCHDDSRPHSSLECDSPIPREADPPERGAVIAATVLGGLHHRYYRRTA